MEIITAQTVEEVCQRMWNMSEQEAYRLSYVLEKEQPLLVAYLATVNKDLFNRSERELLFYLGTVVWQIMSTAKKPLAGVSRESLLEIDNANNQIADSLENEKKVVFTDVVKKVLKECRQSEVLRYVIAVLMDENSAENEVRDEVLGFIILHLKTVIECFDQTT